MPRSAPRPEATKRATGVANPSAHGQAITRTVIAVDIENERDSSAMKYQYPNVASERAVTTGTKIDAILSGSF